MNLRASCCDGLRQQASGHLQTGRPVEEVMAELEQRGPEHHPSEMCTESCQFERSP
jgi:hypothetical protein